LLQLELFSDLPIPLGASQWKRYKPHHSAGSEKSITAEQMAFSFRLRALVCDRDDAFDYPQHSVVSAAAAPAPKTKAHRSIFDFAAAVAKVKKRLRTVDSNAVHQTPLAGSVQVENATGVTKYVGAAYPSRWTVEEEERERQRRARQKPPRPTRKARTMGRRLADLIGPEVDEE
jgi:hypothetical protein